MATGASVIPTVRWVCPCGQMSRRTWGPDDVRPKRGYPHRRAKMALREHLKDCALAKDGRVEVVEG